MCAIRRGARPPRRAGASCSPWSPRAPDQCGVRRGPASIAAASADPSTIPLATSRDRVATSPISARRSPLVWLATAAVATTRCRPACSSRKVGPSIQLMCVGKCRQDVDVAHQICLEQVVSLRRESRRIHCSVAQSTLRCPKLDVIPRHRCVHCGVHVVTRQTLITRLGSAGVADEPRASELPAELALLPPRTSPGRATGTPG